MLNAFLNNSLLKNTNTSFYTILASNIYKNHNLAKQKNELKSAPLENDNNSNKKVKKSKICKPKKKSPKLKYTEIRICGRVDKSKDKMICICMPISKFKEIRSNEKSQETAQIANKCSSVICTQSSQPFCWVTPQEKPCQMQTWILGGPPKTYGGVPCYTNRASKFKTLERKTAPPTTFLMKPRSSIKYCAPSCSNNCVQPKQPKPNICGSPKNIKSKNSWEIGSTSGTHKQPGLANSKKHLKN